MPDSKPVIDGKRPKIRPELEGNRVIIGCATSDDLFLTHDGKWRGYSEVDVWPTREDAEAFIASLAPSPPDPLTLDKLDSSSVVGWYECELHQRDSIRPVCRWWDGAILCHEPGRQVADIRRYSNFRRLVPAAELESLLASRAGQGDEEEAKHG